MSAVSRMMAGLRSLVVLASLVLAAGAWAADQDPTLNKILPTLRLPSSSGKSMTLPKDLLGKWTVLYFYPKDESPGCTKEACTFRDGLTKFKSLNVRLVGVSADDLKSHAEFSKNHALNFPLLSDADHRLAENLGVFQGGMISRDTFLISPEGKVAQVWRAVDPAATTDQAYDAVKARVGGH